MVPSTRQHLRRVRKTLPAYLHDELPRDSGHRFGEIRRASARTVNLIMAATYWQVGQRTVEFEEASQRGTGWGQQETR